MRVLAIVLSLVLISSVAFAKVTAEVLKKDLEDNGNIRVYTQYKIDGVEVVSRYPKLGGKYYWITRYTALIFAGMTDAQMEARILQDVNIYAERLTLETFIEKNNINIVANNLKTLVGSTVSKDSTTIRVDTDGDNIVDTEWTVKTDGTKTETPIITP